MTIEEAEALGWDVERVSLYDEEGLEGWRFTSPDGEEEVQIGDWYEEPPWPDELVIQWEKVHGKEYKEVKDEMAR